MRNLAFIFSLTTTISLGQTTTGYDWDYVIKRVRNNQMNVTAGTREIIFEISNSYEGENEQKELIKFYRSTYDFKTVDKTILKNLIDSLAQSGLNEEIKSLAVEARNSIEFRLLNKKIKDFSFPDKDGNQISLKSLNDKVVII